MLFAWISKKKKKEILAWNNCHSRFSITDVSHLQSSYLYEAENLSKFLLRRTGEHKIDINSCSSSIDILIQKSWSKKTCLGSEILKRCGIWGADSSLKGFRRQSTILTQYLQFTQIRTTQTTQQELFDFSYFNYWTVVFSVKVKLHVQSEMCSFSWQIHKLVR